MRPDPGRRCILSSSTLAHEAAEAALALKAEGVVILDLRGLSPIADFFVICTGVGEVHEYGEAEGSAGTLIPIVLPEVLDWPIERALWQTGDRACWLATRDGFYLRERRGWHRKFHLPVSTVTGVCSSPRGETRSSSLAAELTVSIAACVSLTAIANGRCGDGAQKTFPTAPPARGISRMQPEVLYSTQ